MFVSKCTKDHVSFFFPFGHLLVICWSFADVFVHTWMHVLFYSQAQLESRQLRLRLLERLGGPEAIEACTGNEGDFCQLDSESTPVDSI